MSGRVHRWFGVGLTGALFAIMAVVSVGPVAADGLVSPVPGQDPQSPVQVVSSPGFIQNGTAQVPTGINGGLYGSPYYGGQYYYYGGPALPPGAYWVNAQYYYLNGLYYDVNGNLVSGVPFGVVPVGAIPGYAYAGYCGIGGACGITAAGPIVGYNGNGQILVQDARTGDVDSYTIDPNSGKYCETDGSGNALKGTSCNP
jgi:hypothetical protein